MSVIVMRGIPGSGKSTWARQEISNFLRNPGHRLGCIVSADDYFLVHGEYKFDPTQIGRAHQQCFRQFMRQLHEHAPEWSLVIVDNTNTRLWECSPYILAAEAYNHDVRVVTFRSQSSDDVAACAARNIHGVPEKAVVAMDHRFEPSLLHWNGETTPIKTREEPVSGG